MSRGDVRYSHHRFAASHHMESSAGLGGVQPTRPVFWGIISQLTYILVVKPSSRVGALECAATGSPQAQATKRMFIKAGMNLMARAWGQSLFPTPTHTQSAGTHADR